MCLHRVHCAPAIGLCCKELQQVCVLPRHCCRCAPAPPPSPPLLLLLLSLVLQPEQHLESVATLGVGTPDYMPPEMVRAQMKQQQPQQRSNSGSLPPYDAKAVDAWAMGVLLYLLVTGCYPFEVSTLCRLTLPTPGAT